MLRRALKGLFHWAIALLILFEEWGWVPLANALARIGQLPAFRWIERSIRALPPYCGAGRIPAADARAAAGQAVCASG
jgi:hypothetical protein